MTTSPARSGHAPVNGVDLYYEIHGEEIHGEGRPLVLLHGGLGSAAMYEPIIPALAQGRQVIGVDLQGHGATADVDRPLRFETMADDVAALIRHLGHERADVAGYSLGGGAAIQTAIRHPEVVRKLVVVSAPCRRDGWYPEVLAGMAQMGAAAAEMLKQSPMYQHYARVAPRPEDWPVLLDKTGDLLRQDYDWSKDVAEVTAPTMLVFGDADSIRPSHAVEFFELVGGGKGDAGWDRSNMPRSRLAVLPGTTHYESFMSPLLPPLVAAFLDAPEA